MDYMLFQNDEYITSIVAKEDFVKAYCQEKGYTYKRVPNVPEPEPEPTLDDRVSSLETTKADQTDVDELNEALDMILTGYAGEEATDAEGTAG